MLNVQDGISKIDRVRTGISGLDNIIQGGFPKNSITLVSGPPGGGKSIFCFQFLWEGIKNGEKCLFLTLDKKPEGLIEQAKKLGFDFESAIGQGLIKFEYLNINKKLEDAPETINESPYDDGWLVELEIKDKSEINNLIDADSYKKTI